MELKYLAFQSGMVCSQVAVHVFPQDVQERCS